MATRPERMVTGTAARLEQAPVGDRRYALRVLPVLVGRNARRWTRFRVSMAMDLLADLAQASVFFFVGAALVAGGAGWLENYAGFLAVGIVVNAVLAASLRGPYQSLATDYWMGRLETLLLSPCPVGWALLGDVVWLYARALQNAAAMVLVGWGFGAQIQGGPVQIAGAAAVVLLGAVAVLGLGLVSAAMFMLVNAKGWSDPVGWAIGVAQGLAAGVYFPIAILPGPLRALAQLLPHTYTIDAARRLLLPSADLPALPLHAVLAPLTPLQADLAALVLAAALLPCLGAAAFAAGLAKARTDGGLSRWT